MAKIFTLAPYVAVDGNGNPMAGAQLFFYVTGSSTPKDTFSDAGLTTPNSNPVVADSNGLFGPIYLAQDTDYKLILKTSAGVTVATRDPLLVNTLSVIAHQGSLIVGNASGADSELLISPTNGARLTSDGTTAVWRLPNFTSQVFLSGSGTYTTPPNCTAIEVDYSGGGGGGGAVGASTAPSGSVGGNTTFNGVVATGGNPGTGGTGSALGVGGATPAAGSGTATERYPGNSGGAGSEGVTTRFGGTGGASPLFGGAPVQPPNATIGNAGAASSGAGGTGAGGTPATVYSGGGGSSGEGVKLIILNPSATYAYSIGTGGAGGIGTGTAAETGGSGAGGRISVKEFYA